MTMQLTPATGDGLWQVLRPGTPGSGDDGGVVLAVDFSPGSARATFADLVPHLTGPQAWWLCTPVASATAPLPWDAGPYLDALAASVLARLGTGTRVDAFVGHCAGATIACALAARASAGTARPSGPPPTVVLVDPEIVGPDSLLTQFRRSVTALADGCGDDTARAAAEDAGRLADGAPSVDELGRRLCREYDRICRATMAAVGLDDSLAEELAGLFTDFLRYLVAAARLQRTPWPFPAVRVLSADDPYPGAVRAEHRFPARPRGLLDEPAVGAALAALVTRSLPGTGDA